MHGISDVIPETFIFNKLTILYHVLIGLKLSMSTIINLHSAKKAKNDEFYTQYEDIAKELPYYKEQLVDKIVYCNCDNPLYSNFYKYLKEHFSEYKLKLLIATHIGLYE